MSTAFNSNEPDEILLEIVGRKFFDLISQAGDVSLISNWYNICNSSVNGEELQRLVDQSRDVADVSSTIENEGPTFGIQTSHKGASHTRSSRANVHMSSLATSGFANWRKKKEVMQPIEVIVDDNAVDMEVDNLPSTSSSVISSHADTQQDAKVYTRIGELRSAGLWSATRLPMCVEPPRPKLHWDFFLEEVLWMSADFRSERGIKRRLARKLCSEAKQKWRKKFDSKKDEKASREKEAKRICASVAKMVKEFWLNVDKVVDFRTKEIVESQKRKALDQHLTFLVGEADKLSTLLHERLVNSPEPSSKPSTTSKKSYDFEMAGRSERFAVGKRPHLSTYGNSDDEAEFELDTVEEDDESTIKQAEKRINKATVDAELNDLSQMADLDDDDFFDSLPPGYLEKFYKGDTSNEVNEETEELPNTSASMNAMPVGRDEITAKVNGNDNGDDVMDTSVAPTPSAVDMAAVNEDEVVMQEDTITIEDEPPDLSKVDYSNLKSDNQEIRRRELNNIAEVASEFQPKGNTLETTQVKTEVPFLLRGNLREYQLVGLDWLVTLYEKNLNGILADEMGLGKTIQTVALLAHLACEKMIWGPHIIIVPTSVILNWEMEFKKWCPSLKILTYFGSAKERADKRKGWTKNNAFHVCITSYKVASQDIKALKSKAWQYMILDEAQNIKNFKSQRWQTLLNIRSRRRLLLTGTPLQNSLMELWSLLHFLMPAVFASHEDFKDWFSNPMNSMVEGNIDVDKALIQRLHKVLRPFILRRLKSEVECQLPTKQEKVITCPLSKRQRFLYNEFLSRKDTRDNLQSGNMMSVLNVIMQLRKCCNHPNLFEPRPVISPLVIRPFRLSLPRLAIVEPLRLNSIVCDESDSLPCWALMRLNMFGLFNEWDLFERVSNTEAIRRSDGKPAFSSNLPKISGLKFCVNGLSASFIKSDKETSPSNTQSNGINGDKIIEKDKKISLKAYGLLKNGRKRSAAVMLANDEDTKAPPQKRSCRFDNICVELRQHRETENRRIGQWLTKLCQTAGAPLLADETVQLMRRMFNCTRIEYAKVTPRRTSKQMFSSSFRPCKCYTGYVATHTTVPSSSTKIVTTSCMTSPCSAVNWEEGPFASACETISTRISDWLRSSIRGFILYVNKILCEGPHLDVRLSAYENFNGVVCEQVSKIIYAKQSSRDELINISHYLQFPELRLIEYDCGKLQTLSKLLKQLYENKHRCLIFTQMSRMLDILQAFLSYYSYRYFRLDGSTHIDQRQAMMERFNNDSSIFCFILSTRSGGVGVNLTGADTVIFYDSDWNPTMDAQAQDRCHRIGQTRNVTIYRLISEKTIEENILKKANQKRRLGEMALDEAEFTPQFFRSTDNIRDLFSNEESVAEIVAPFASDTKEIEQAMASAEDQQDVLAAKMAQAEASADIAEFDDGRLQSQLLRPSSSMSQAGARAGDQAGSSSKYLNDVENASEQYIELISSMTPVERYAIAFLENEYRPELEEEVKEATALIEAKKEDYLKKSGVDVVEDMDVDENNEDVAGRRVKLVEHDTYDDDLLKEAFSPDFNIETIPLWMPPSPPNSEAGDGDSNVFTLLSDGSYFNVWNEDYDSSLALYEPCLIPELKLPPLPPTPLPSASAAGVFLRHGIIASTRLNSKHHGDRTRDGDPRRHESPQVDSAATSTTRDIKSSLLKRRTDGQSSTKKSRIRRDECLKLDSSRRSKTPVYASQSPSPRSGTPGRDAELNNAIAGVTAAARADSPQKIDESIERVRRNSTQRTPQRNSTPQPSHPPKAAVPPLALYVSAHGSLENRREILYYPGVSVPSIGGSTAGVPPFSRNIGPNGEQVAPHGGFLLPSPRLHETDDLDEGMRWFMEEDCRLLVSILAHTKMTTTMLGESCLELNWNYVAHYVNVRSLQYRSPRSCFHRYQTLYVKVAEVCMDPDTTRYLEQKLLRMATEMRAAYGQFHPNSIMTTYYNNKCEDGDTVPRGAKPSRYVLYVSESQRERQNTADIYRRAKALNEAAAMPTFGPFQMLEKCIGARANLEL